MIEDRDLQYLAGAAWLRDFEASQFNAGAGMAEQSNLVVDHANKVRKQIKEVAAGLKELTARLRLPEGAAHRPVANGAPATPEREAIPADWGEIIANAMLAYRHLEDASQRMGKVIQAADGGTSVYDRSTTVGAKE